MPDPTAPRAGGTITDPAPAGRDHEAPPPSPARGPRPAVPRWLLWAAGGAVLFIVGIVLTVVRVTGGGGGTARQHEGRPPRPGESAGGPRTVRFGFALPKV